MRCGGSRLFAPIPVAILVVVFASPAPADVLARFAVPGAGCLGATSEGYRLSAALGQSVVGRCASESYTMTAGFWCVPGSTIPIAVGPEAGPGALRLLGVRPNPSVADAAVVFDLPAAATVRVRVLDVGGRWIRTVAAGPRAAGRHVLRWDGRDDAGARAPAGLYWVEVTAGADHAFLKSIRLR